jgi:RNA polymerase sigma-70 factor (ECF subfamily)
VTHLERAPDALLVRRVAEGDQAAFAELYGRHSTAVRAYVRRRVADPDRAEELAQEVFLDAWRGATRYDAEVAPVAAWLRTIATRRSVDWLRRSSVRPPLAEHEGREPAEPDRSGRVDARLDMLDALRDLPPAQRETLMLAFYGDLTYPEIAERTETPLGTVKSRALLGMRRLSAVSPRPSAPSATPVA